MLVGYPNNPKHSLEKEIAWALSNDFDYMELYLEEGKTNPASINFERIKALLSEFPLVGSGHIPWYLPIGSPLPEIRNAAFTAAERYFKVFEAVGISRVAVHAHWCGSFQVRDMIFFQVETLNKIAASASSFGIKLMLELTDRKEDSPENIKNILAQTEGVGFLLDSGHANLWGRKPGDYVDILSSYLEHVHLHDNFRDSDLHLPITCGNIDWEQFLKVLKKRYDKTFTLEIFSKSRDYLLLSRDKLKKYWEKA